jgi:hypothetical protein
VEYVNVVPMFQGMVTLQVMIEAFTRPFEFSSRRHDQQKPPLLHHPWLQDKKEILNECEIVKKICKEGGIEKNVTRKHKANKKSECIQSHPK